MLKTVLLFLFSTLLFSNNPIVYAALGDVIYNNVQNIKKLKTIDFYQAKYEDIDTYLSKVARTKEMGFAIENGDKTIDKKVYLQDLRALSKTNDAFIRSANTTFKNALKDEDSILFSQLVNSGLLNTQKYKHEISDYYYNHKEDINITSVIENYLDTDKKRVANKKKHKYHNKIKKMKEAEKIHRIREQDLQDQKNLEKKLDDEVKRKKLEIQKEQQKEFFH